MTDVIDYGVKAPTIAVLLDNLAAAHILLVETISAEELAELRRGGTTGMLVAEGETIRIGRPADEHVSLVYLDRIERVSAVYAEDSESIVTPAEMTEDVHADLRLSGPEAQARIERLKRRTLVSLKADPVDQAPVTKGRADGFKIFPRLDPEGNPTIATPAHQFA